MSKTKPADKFRVGRINVTIWRNESDNGPFFAADFERRYKAKDGSWKTSSYGKNDLLQLEKAAAKAWERMEVLTEAEGDTDE